MTIDCCTALEVKKKQQQHKIEVKTNSKVRNEEDGYIVCIHLYIFYKFPYSFRRCMCLLFLHRLFYLHLTNDDDNSGPNNDDKVKKKKNEIK